MIKVGRRKKAQIFKIGSGPRCKPIDFISVAPFTYNNGFTEVWGGISDWKTSDIYRYVSDMWTAYDNSQICPVQTHKNIRYESDFGHFCLFSHLVITLELPRTPFCPRCFNYLYNRSNKVLEIYSSEIFLVHINELLLLQICWLDPRGESSIPPHPQRCPPHLLLTPFFKKSVYCEIFS